LIDADAAITLPAISRQFAFAGAAVSRLMLSLMLESVL
jgi:hypothetical protein